jgi:hypothetical protein
MTASETLRNSSPWSWIVVTITLCCLWHGCDPVYDANCFAFTAGNCLSELRLNSVRCLLAIVSKWSSIELKGFDHLLSRIS